MSKFSSSYKGEAEFFGEWTKLQVFLNVKASGKTNHRKALDALGSAIIQQARSKIDQGDSSWASLAEATVAKKGHGHIYIDKNEYRSSFKSAVREEGSNKWTLYVGPGGTHSSGVPMQEVGMYAEFGSGNQPARALWRTILHNLQNTVAFRNFRKEINK